VQRTLKDLKGISSSRLSTGIISLDRALGGGLPPGTVSEVYGEFGSGKTQLCHQLSVNVQLPREMGGLEGKAVYIDTEGTFRAERIIQMAKAKGLDPDKALENILVARILDTDKLEHDLRYLLKWGREMGVKLLVIDTLTPYFREKYAHGGRIGRYLGAVWIVYTMKRIALQVEMPVVFTSKVVVKLNGKQVVSSSGRWIQSRINTVIGLFKGDGFVEAVVEYSSYSRVGRAKFIIGEEGLIDMGGVYDGY